ncbi:MAG TPA: Crp/Fnr family transcriptional regulator [Flavisolibacter sp.]|nr:Crp/Fnr family transcriptional regulator [Flavisolibacter sp.]
MPSKSNPVALRWNTPDGHSPYVHAFQAVHSLSNAAIQYLDRETYCRTLTKGDFLARPGFSTNCLYLVLKGVVRGYRKLQKKEITTWINEENEIVGSIQDLGMTENKSDEYIQVIEDTELVALPKAGVDFLYRTCPETNMIGRKILEESYRAAEERAFICRIPSAELRYRLFLKTSPQLVNRIPLKYIASYLGMTLETLSRVRNQKTGTK